MSEKQQKIYFFSPILVKYSLCFHSSSRHVLFLINSAIKSLKYFKFGDNNLKFEKNKCTLRLLWWKPCKTETSSVFVSLQRKQLIMSSKL